ncbi:hypothetical protein BDB00DRAFT_860797 [Zychaea mexicana]|uniref:uncharacterized protein n=1 Tax=Zychaea mexicana TaxID=64656 RepID=UPI0022FE6867|nr:uncharacterized protein BDB00DRAFT_860797 [Zychaea mexicana]KAI9472951.1 hypothetical protein BDB00DRAFT_860797 [Zychaea mexicana]
MTRWSGCLLLALGILQWLTPSIQAIYESQAGVIDWHHAWVGKTRWAHSIGTSRLVVGTERNVMASLDTESGAIVWRQVLDHPVKEFHATSSGILTVSQAPPSVAQLWDVTTGRLVWERALGKSAATAMIAAEQESGDDSVIIASSNGKLVRLSSASGRPLWNMDLPNSDVNVIAVQKRDQTVYVVEQTEGRTSLTVSTFRYDTGERLNTIKHSVSATTTDNVLVLGPYLVWTEKDTVKWNELGSKKVQKATVSTLVGSLKSFTQAEPQTVALAPGDSESILLLSAYNLGQDRLTVSSAALQIQAKSIELIQDLGIQDSFGAADASGTSGVTRLSKHSQSELLFETISREEHRKQVKVAHDFTLSGDVAYGKVASVDPLRAFVVTESGSTFMYGEQGELKWSRDEGMAHATVTEFLDLPEKQMTQLADVEEEVPAAVSPYIRYWHRLQAHAAELQHLPEWILSRYTPSKSRVNTLTHRQHIQSCYNGTTTTDHLYRDKFGLRKLLITATETGQVIVRDSANGGAPVWSRYFGQVRFDHVVVVRSVSVKLPPLIVVIGRSGDGVSYEETHFYRLNALTGQDYVATSLSSEMQEFFDPQLVTETRIAKVMRLPIEEPDEHTHILALYEAGSSRVYIYPDTEGSRQSFQNYLDNFYFVHQRQQKKDKGGASAFKGYQVLEGYRGSLTAQPVWSLDIPQDESVVAVGERATDEKVALIGRVLGNRNVMYKYLNPHMFAVMTTQPGRSTLKVRLVDGVKGTVLYETVHQNVDAVENPVHVVQAENWIIYHFWSNDSRNKGYQAVVLELYEGEYENERIASTNFSSFDNVRPYVQSSAYAFPYAVEAIGVTVTRNGVSTRDILFGIGSNQIVGINKRFLDPRRPTDKPSKEEQEEGLIPYSPIPEDRQLFLTYSLEVFGIKKIITTPTLLESTSVVFAYGLDTFFTQSSPSRRFDVLSEDFSKSQLIMTIVGLVAAIAVAGPMVRRKRVNALWK